MVGRLLPRLGVLVIVFAALPAAAQQADAPGPSADVTTFYAHSKGSGATLWLNSVKEDPDGTDTTVNLVFGDSISGSASFPLTPALATPVTLDGEANIEFNIRFGSGLAANVGTVSTELTLGNTVIASASGSLAATANSYGDVKLTAKPTVTALDPGAGNLVWTIQFDGAGTAYLQVSQSGQWCNLVLPIVAAASTAPVGNDTNGANSTNVTENATADANTTAPTNGTANQTGNQTSNQTSNVTEQDATAPPMENDAAVDDAAAAKEPKSVPVSGLVLLAPSAAALMRRLRASDKADTKGGLRRQP